MTFESIPPDENRPVVQVQPTPSNRPAIWALSGVALGFMLPVCGCLFLTFGLLFGTAAVPAPATTGGGVAVSSGSGTDAIAVVRVEGVITSGDDENNIVGAASARVIADLELAEADDTVKAIVLRVDSPGGSVTGSAQIYEAILEIEKPIVVSMVGTAASGGYYVSAPTDYIFARPDTVTGSIGVILQLLNASELADELGVTYISVTSGEFKDIGDPFSAFAEEDRAIYQTLVDEFYTEFVRVVADGRGMTTERATELADGRIYTGRQAVANGLVDELGDFEAALAKAAELGGISEEYRTIEYQRTPSFEDLVFGFGLQAARSQEETAQAIIDTALTPRLEYRYMGPQSN